MRDPNKEVLLSPFGAHFHWWPSPLSTQPSPQEKKNVTSLIATV